jgi:23S rRNA pseudouridine1911/1915/1917 synthase
VLASNSLSAFADLRGRSENRPVACFPYTTELIVERYLDGVRVDTFLAHHFRNYTPFRIQRIVRAGQVKIDCATVGIVERVYYGDTVNVRLLEPPDKLHRPEQLPLAIVFEDPWIIVVDKPAGQIVHPAGYCQTGTLCNALQAHFDQESAWPGLLRPGIVHRLDRMTSGLIVVTKEHLSHRLLSIQFQRERVSKTYLALVEGLIETDQGTIDLPIGTSPDVGSVLMSCQPTAGDPRLSITEFEVVERYECHSLVRAHPRTGRNHQIRVHFAAIGHPLVDDEFYGPFGQIKLTKAEYAALQKSRSAQSDSVLDDENQPTDRSPDQSGGRHALHAHRLEFQHPILGGHVAFQSPLPDDLRRMIDCLSPSTS